MQNHTFYFILPHEGKYSLHSLLAFAKFNKAVSILPLDAKALLEIFCPIVC